MSFLFHLIIMPLVFIYELVFYACCNYLEIRAGLKDYLLIGIIIVSIFVNMLSLPLYNAADRLQKNEREKQKSMEKVVSHIKASFNGDERFLILNSYYRLENYNPIYQLKAAIPLLLQIPFFTAAYYFFTNTNVFIGRPLYCFPLLRDLSKPDMLLTLYGHNINILPIIMTVINLVSSFIYTKNLSFKDKLQPIMLAIIFLVLLYNSPSALVIYWTLNNIFSLVKIFITCILEKNKKNDVIELVDNIKIKSYDKLAIVSLLTIFILLAVFIPSNIIASSPNEFTISTPFNILKFTITIFLGYLLWELLYYFMLPNKVKYIGASFIFATSIYLLLNHTVFLNDVGFITENLFYSDGFPRFNINDIKKDVLIVIFVLLMFIFSTKFTKISSIINTLILLSIFSVCIINFYRICTLHKMLLNSNSVIDNQNVRDTKDINFSTNGKNVVVIMLDRSCGAYFNFVLSNKPELKNIYDGFTFYENTLSCGSLTLFGSPPLFGGYDYLPQNANKRNDTLLVDKHNEALTIMPYNFSNNGYNCTIANLPYENYNIVGKEPLMSNMNNVNRINLTDGAVNKFFYSNLVDYNYGKNAINRAFVFYSIMKTMPVVVKGIIYNDGYYLDGNISLGLRDTLVNYYAFDNLINKFNFSDDSSNNFLMFDNELTHNHNRNILPYDTFSPDVIEDINTTIKYPVKNNLYGEEFVGDYSHLSTEIAAYLQIAKFLEYLKNNNVYDNTRIIIVGDHGTDYNHSVDNKYYFECENGRYITVDNYNPTLLYKDFFQHGSLNVNDDFMTNADTVLLSMDKIIDNPINPYLNKKIVAKDRDVDQVDIYFHDKEKGYNPFNYKDDYIFTNSNISCKPLNIFDKDSWLIREDNVNE